MLLSDKQTKPKPKVKAESMNPYTKKPAVKAPTANAGSSGKTKSVGAQPKGARGSKVERA